MVLFNFSSQRASPISLMEIQWPLRKRGSSTRSPIPLRSSSWRVWIWVQSFPGLLPTKVVDWVPKDTSQLPPSMSGLSPSTRASTDWRARTRSSTTSCQPSNSQSAGRWTTWATKPNPRWSSCSTSSLWRGNSPRTRSPSRLCSALLMKETCYGWTPLTSRRTIEGCSNKRMASPKAKQRSWE